MKMELFLFCAFLIISAFSIATENPITPYRFPVTPVDICPRNAAAFEKASRRKNCSGHTRYMCAPNKYLSNLIEFCTDQRKTIYKEGNCVILEGTGDLHHYSCAEKFNSSCPKTPYFDDEIYDYPACLEINTHLQCFVADKDCQERILSTAMNTDRAYIAILFCVFGLLLVAGILVWIMCLYIKKRKKDAATINLHELREFLKKGQMKISHTRGIIVGCAGAGKTTLLMRLQDITYKDVKERNTAAESVDVNVNNFVVLEELMTIKVAEKKKDAEPQIITFSKEDMRNVPSELRQSDFNDDHGNDKENDDNKASKTDTFGEYEGCTNPLLLNATDNIASKLETNNDVHTQTQAHVRYENAEKNDISTMNSSATKKESMSTIMDAVRNLSRKNQRHPRITFLDFGGKSMYYAFHQIYLSPKTFYILVLDMSKRLDEKVNKIEDSFGGQFESWTYKDYYKFWLKSIDSFSDIHTPVIVIGTHAENISETECRMFFGEFFKIFDGRVDLQRHLHTDRRFVIKFPDKGSKLENLTEIKHCLARLVKALPYSEETIRPACAIFEYILQREKKRKIVSRKMLSKLNESLDIEFRLSELEITETLKILHRFGSLLYFNEEELRDIVILDVQWFVNAFKCVITDSQNVENIINKELLTFHKTGELSDEKFVAIWMKPQNKKNGYEKHKHEILKYMEHLGLLAIFNKKDMSSTETNSVWYYFPSMNQRKFGKEIKDLKQYATSSILCFQFDEEGQLPLFIFYRLVSKCYKLSDWSISEEGDVRSIYQNVACFTFKGHYVVICICKFQIQVQVCKPIGQISLNILDEVQTTIEKGIKEFKKYTYVIGYKCENGLLCCEEDNSFIALEKFPVFEYLCNTCGVCRIHYVGNSICWIKKDHSEAANFKFESSQEETDEGRTSIHRILQACLDGNAENFLFHLKTEVRVRKHLLLKTDRNGWNIIHFAAKGGNLRIFQHLQSETLDVGLKTHDQMTVLHIATQSGHFDLCKYILEKNEFKDILKARSVIGKNACHYAAEIGSVKIFQLLVAKGISPVETTNNGQNAFHISCIYSKLEMCEYISERYVSLIHKESEEGWNATLYTAKNGHTNVLKFLNAKKVSFEHKSESDRNALHIACDNGHFEACEYISENFPSLLTASDHKGRYAAHFAARSGSLEIIKYLELKTVVTKKTYIGINILHIVCLHEHVEMCKYLLERYPDLNIKRTETGWTTAHFVAGNVNKNGHEIDIFEMLLRAERPVDITLLTVNGNSVLTLAIKYNAYNFADYLLTNYPYLLGIPNANNPFNTGNENPKMLSLLEKHLGTLR